MGEGCPGVQPPCKMRRRAHGKRAWGGLQSTHPVPLDLWTGHSKYHSTDASRPQSPLLPGQGPALDRGTCSPTPLMHNG